MKEIKLPESELKKVLNMNAARVNFIACFIIPLLKVCTVNFKMTAAAFPGKASAGSRYKRIRRFFRFFPLDSDMTAGLLPQWLPAERDRLLSIDRTDWKSGKTDTGILTSGVCRVKIAFPLLREALPKQGNPGTDERIRLIGRFIRIFGAGKIGCPPADREFTGEHRSGYLIRPGIGFRIRIMDNFRVPNSEGIPVPVGNLFRHPGCGGYLIINDLRKIPGHDLFLTGAGDCQTEDT